MDSLAMDFTEDGKKRCRYACTFCSDKKIKCDGAQPCNQCTRRNLHCVYATKKKTPPSKQPKRTPEMTHQYPFDAATQPTPALPAQVQQQPRPAAPVSSSLRIPGNSQVFGPPMAGGGVSPIPGVGIAPSANFGAVSGIQKDTSHSTRAFAPMEMQFLKQYIKYINVFVPFVPHSVIRDALNPVPLQVLGITTSKLDQVKQSAAKACAWGAVSMGASMLEDNRAADYVKTAVANLRDCFDSPCHESFCAYLSVSYAFCMIGNRNAFLRYAAFAVLIRREVVPPDLGIEADAAMNFIQTQALHSTNGQRKLGKFKFPDPTIISKYPTNIQAIFTLDETQKNIMGVLSDASASGEEKMREFMLCIQRLEPLHAKLDDEECSNPNPMALLVCKAMLGYALTHCERAEEGLRFLREVVDLVEPNRYLLCTPLTWHSCNTISRCFSLVGEPELNSRLQTLLQPSAGKWEKKFSATALSFVDVASHNEPATSSSAITTLSKDQMGNGSTSVGSSLLITDMLLSVGGQMQNTRDPGEVSASSDAFAQLSFSHTRADSQHQQEQEQHHLQHQSHVQANTAGSPSSSAFSSNMCMKSTGQRCGCPRCTHSPPTTSIPFGRASGVGTGSASLNTTSAQSSNSFPAHSVSPSFEESEINARLPRNTASLLQSSFGSSSSIPLPSLTYASGAMSQRPNMDPSSGGASSLHYFDSISGVGQPFFQSMQASLPSSFGIHTGAQAQQPHPSHMLFASSRGHQTQPHQFSRFQGPPPVQVSFGGQAFQQQSGTTPASLFTAPLLNASSMEQGSLNRSQSRIPMDMMEGIMESMRYSHDGSHGGRGISHSEFADMDDDMNEPLLEDILTDDSYVNVHAGI